MQCTHRPIDGKSTAQFPLIENQLPIRADLHDAGQTLDDDHPPDVVFQCRPAFYLLDKVECVLDRHDPTVSYWEGIINRNGFGTDVAMTYDLFAYGKMIADASRMEAYAGALRKLIDSDKVVLDIGTGTGILALLACQCGAQKVYAVEPDSAVHLAKEICAANGWSDKIRFYQKRSAELALPEPVDIIVSDLRGVLPLFQNHIPSIIDARDRLLSGSGTVVPQRDQLYISIVSAPDLMDAYRHPWVDSPFGIQMQPAVDCLFHLWRKASFQKQDLLSQPALWASLDYRTIEQAGVQGSVELEIERGSEAHGFAVWFDTDLLEDTGFSSGPGNAETVYGQAFFPWPEAVALETGDTVSVSLRAVYAGNDYVWWWNSKIFQNRGSNRLKAEFRQSTFFAKPLGLQNLHKRDSLSAPQLGTSGRIDRFILQQMDGRQTLNDIARFALEKFPDTFPTVKDALRRVADLSEKYSRDEKDRP